MRNNISVIIPSYNAGKSIIQAIRNVFAHLPKSKLIIIDDSSPDETAKIINKYFLKDKRLTLIVRKEKEGRGSAILRGFQEGLKDKSTEFFVEMDADLCHDARYIPIMIKKCRTYDVVIASKYLKKSKVRGLNIKRKIFSKIVNFYLKLVLQLPITDYTNGFRCYRRKVLEEIDFKSFHSRGFILLSEIAYKIYKKGNSFGEIPFDFDFKEANKSNFNFAEIREAFVTVLKLRFNFK